jgi:hypothetical protein
VEFDEAMRQGEMVTTPFTLDESADRFSGYSFPACYGPSDVDFEGAND